MNYRYDETGDRCGKMFLLMVVCWIGGAVVAVVAGYFILTGYSLIYWTQEPVGWVLHVLGWVLLVVGVCPLAYFSRVAMKKVMEQ
jgi:hypothetical protein